VTIVIVSISCVKTGPTLSCRIVRYHPGPYLFSRNYWTANNFPPPPKPAKLMQKQVAVPMLQTRCASIYRRIH
jgi:hypothetical protein